MNEQTGKRRNTATTTAAAFNPNSRNVRNGPASFLADALFRRRQQSQQARQCVVVDDELRLQIVTRDNVANRSERRRLHGRTGVEQQFDEPTTDSSFNDGLNLFVGTVREIRKRPTSVRQHFLVRTENELRQSRETGAHQFKIGLGLAAAKIRQSPGGVAEHTDLAILVELVQQRVHCAGLQDKITAGRRISGDVPEGPDSLFADIVVGTHEQSDKNGHGADFHDDFGVLGSAGCDICERPGGFESEIGF